MIAISVVGDHCGVVERHSAFLHSIDSLPIQCSSALANKKIDRQAEVMSESRGYFYQPS